MKTLEEVIAAQPDSSRRKIAKRVAELAAEEKPLHELLQTRKDIQSSE